MGIRRRRCRGVKISEYKLQEASFPSLFPVFTESRLPENGTTANSKCERLKSAPGAKLARVRATALKSVRNVLPSVLNIKSLKSYSCADGAIRSHESQKYANLFATDNLLHLHNCFMRFCSRDYLAIIT